MPKDPTAVTDRKKTDANRNRYLGNVILADLTERELEVLKKLVTGVSNKTIAEEMHLSVDTVKYHLKNLLIKTGCKTRTELAVKACLCGIQPPEDIL